VKTPLSNKKGGMNLTDTPVEFSFLYDDDLIAMKPAVSKPKLIRQHSGPLPPIPVSSMSMDNGDMSNGSMSNTAAASSVMSSDSFMSKLSDDTGIQHVFPQNEIPSTTNGKFLS
jgi:hypothetical protein